MQIEHAPSFEQPQLSSALPRFIHLVSTTDSANIQNPVRPLSTSIQKLTWILFLIIAGAVPLIQAQSLIIETPISLENTRTWRSVSGLWNDHRGTVFVVFEDSQVRLAVLDGVQLPLNFPIASQSNGAFVGYRYSTNVATRYNPNGSIDPSFVTPAVNQGDLRLSDIVWQPDGKLLFGCYPP